MTTYEFQPILTDFVNRAFLAPYVRVGSNFHRFSEPKRLDITKMVAVIVPSLGKAHASMKTYEIVDELSLLMPNAGIVVCVDEEKVFPEVVIRVLGGLTPRDVSAGITVETALMTVRRILKSVKSQ